MEQKNKWTELIGNENKCNRPDHMKEKVYDQDELFFVTWMKKKSVDKTRCFIFKDSQTLKVIKNRNIHEESYNYRFKVISLKESK